MGSLDLSLFNAINGCAKRYRVLDFWAVFFAEYAAYGLLATVLIFALITDSWQAFFVSIFGGLFSRFFINELVYVFYRRKRPADVLPATANVLIKKPHHPSFPSGHASFFFGLSFSLLLFNLPLAIIFVIISALISLARIFCGVHWPSDIVAGIAAAGISYCMLAYWLVR